MKKLDQAVKALNSQSASYVYAGLLSAALLVLSFPPYSVWGLLFVGLVPFFLALFRARSIWDAVRVGATCGIAFILLGFSWVSFVAINFGGLPWIVGQIVLVLFSIFGELQFFIFALLTYLIFRRLTVLGTKRSLALLFFVGLPAVYVGIDWLYPKIFPTTLGQALYGWFSLAQTAEYVGVYGLTIPILAINLALAVLIEHTWGAGRGAKRIVPIPSRAAAVAAVVVFAAALAVGSSWGTKRIAEIRALEENFSKSFKFSVVQANIGDAEKLASEGGFETAIQKVLGTYRLMTTETINRFNPDLVIWPETAFPFLYTHYQDRAANRSGAARDVWIEDLMREIKTPLYFGSYSRRGKHEFNTAFLIKPPFELISFYRKSILLAFGEYVPLGPLGPFIQEIVPSIADFGRGEGPMVMSFKGIKLGPQICYEGIVPEFSRQSTRLGADVLLNITNDSWFGQTNEPWLHLALTAFRSIETRRPMIRGTNTGVSTVIDRTGEMQWKTRLFEPAILEATLKLPGEGQAIPETFYVRYGEIVSMICVALGGMVLIVLLGPVALKRLRQRREKR